MSGWRFGKRDADGIEKHWRPDGNGGIEVRISQDVSGLLDLNKAMANENDGYSKSREMRRVASIPAILRQKWLIEEGWDCMDTHDPDVARKLVLKLNDPDYAYLRTAEGRLGMVGGVMQ